MHFCSRSWQATRCSVIFLNPLANQQACNGDTPPRPNHRNSRHNRLSLKWYWLCSLTSWPLLLNVKSCNNTVNASCYCPALQMLHIKLNNKRSGELTDGTPCCMTMTFPTWFTLIRTECYETVLKHPAYSPDLSPSDFSVFGSFKIALKVHTIMSDDDVHEMVQWFRQQLNNFL